jgi:hypothetical protein
VHQPAGLYKRHRFPGEIISHAVWLYCRFLLSYRDVEELLARGLLESVGIPAFVSADDAGGMRPPLQLSQGVRLMVREADLARARRVLADHAGEA